MSSPAGRTSPWLTEGMLTELRLQQEYGDFLVARYAGRVGDMAAAATYYRRAFVNAPGDSMLLDDAAFATLAAGEVKTAIGLASRANANVALDAPNAQLALVAQDIASGRVKDALARLRNPGIGVYNSDLRGMLGAWLAASAGEDEPAIMAEWIAPIAHSGGEQEVLRGLVFLARGKDAEALEAIDRARKLPLAAPDLVTALGARLAASRGDLVRAHAMLAEQVAERGEGPATGALQAELKAGRPISKPKFDVRQGAALAIYLASAGGRMRASAELAVQRHALALHLDPGLAPSRLMYAQALESQDRAEDAIAVLAGVSADSPWRAEALIEQGQMLDQLSRHAEALVRAEQAVAASPRRDILAAAGDLHRVNGASAAAVRLYDRVVAGDSAVGAADWRVLFGRAAARRASGDEPGAEQDLVEALLLEPDRPELLNSLGYNWVERGERLEEGLALIERAAAARPDLGYIIDSLGWAHFRLGRFDAAIEYLERAAELSPTNPEVMDHLGDAYWRAGREREARFEWAAALEQQPDAGHASLLREKMLQGLPAASARSLASRP